jgi:hypothetical protein
MIIKRYISQENEIYLCKQDCNKKGIIEEEWRKKQNYNGFPGYSIAMKTVYIPPLFSEKIVDHIGKNGLGKNDLSDLFKRFEKKTEDALGGRIFSVSFDDRFCFSAQIKTIEQFDSLEDFDGIF